MRVFVPATMATLGVLHRDGELPAEAGFAATDRYRAEVSTEVADDDEVLEYELMVAAAAESLHDQDAGQVRRRVVLAVDLPAEPDLVDPASGRVVVEGPVQLADVASVHVDDLPLGPDEDADTRTGTDLSWYARQEIGDLVDTQRP